MFVLAAHRLAGSPEATRMCQVSDKHTEQGAKWHCQRRAVLVKQSGRAVTLVAAGAWHPAARNLEAQES
jgi:hypothetical protein